MEHGQEFKFEIHLSIPIGPFFDMFFAEQFLQSLLDVGGRITEVKSTGWNDIVVYGYADSTNVQGQSVSPTILPVITVAGLLKGFSIALVVIVGIAALVSLITFFVKGGTDLLLNIGGLIAVMLLMMVLQLVSGDGSLLDFGSSSESKSGQKSLPEGRN